jgi:hypothetical protein
LDELGLTGDVVVRTSKEPKTAQHLAARLSSEYRAARVRVSRQDKADVTISFDQDHADNRGGHSESLPHPRSVTKEVS